MQKYIRLTIVVILSAFGANLSSAQTNILDQSLLTAGSFSLFTNFNVSGSPSWYQHPVYGAVCSGYAAGQNIENEDWLVSPAMNLSQTDNVKLTFNHTRGNAAVMNVGVAEGWYTVFATANFTGDPVTTQWIELTGLNQTLPAAWQFIPSGELIIPEFAKSENSRIAFRYRSSATQSATWEIRNVKVTGEPQATNPNAGNFKITNWNIEWLGCNLYGPSNETLQVNNVVAAMLAMNSDIYCIQEITNSASNPSIETLVTLLGSEQWAGAIVPSITGDCDQRQGIIYKKSKVQFDNSAQLSFGNSAQGNTYYYNWSSGRFPALYKVDLVLGNTLVPLLLVNIHAKAEDGNAMSYTRRLGASQALKTILDGATYNAQNLIVIGDFNDYLTGTTSNSCGCTDSPYKNFMDDAGNYTGITNNIIDANTSWGIHPIIEHAILSNELTGNYILNSTTQELGIAQNINSYSFTTSNHLPVSSTFQFAVLGTQEYSSTSPSQLMIFPNPVKAELNFDSKGLETAVATEIYDLTGRQIRGEKMDANTIDVSAFPSGIYLLKVGSRFGRFVKE